MVKMSNWIRRKVLVLILLIILSLSVAACGNTDPYQLGINSFSRRTLGYEANHNQPTSEWTVYVGHGTVTTGWLWFKHENPVIYTYIQISSMVDIKNIVIKFGDKTARSPEIDNTKGGGSAGMGLYLKSSQIPSYMDISWSENGQPHHLKIKAKTMIELDSSS
jgi:hypothetical protein